jgi:hypothetical protein
MLDKIQPEHILFIDIETVPQAETLAEFPEKLQQLWTRKAEAMSKEGESAEKLFDRAGIYAEFGKIVCISCGTIYRTGTKRIYRVKSFYGTDEASLLNDFLLMLEKFMANPYHRLCAHNGMEFDYPYIARRILINGLKLPAILDIAGAKPWEVRDYLLDTMQLWKFGDYKHYTSLDLLCTIFGVQTPKDDIDGSQVANVYYRDGDMTRIARYCEKDTLTVAQIILRFKGEPLIEPENFEIVL